MIDWQFFLLFLPGSLTCICSFFIGLTLTQVLADKRHRTGICAAFNAFLRSRRKAWFNVPRPAGESTPVAVTHQILRERCSSAKSTNADPSALDVARDFKKSLSAQFGDQLAAVYLFGSRARGDHCRGSDVDVAVFLVQQSETPEALERSMIHEACRLLYKHGLCIQPRVFCQDDLDCSIDQRYRLLVDAVIREGIFV